jgi:hypothetical protein
MPPVHAVWVSPTHRSRYQARGRDFPSVEASVEDSGAPPFALSFLLASTSAVDRAMATMAMPFSFHVATSGFGES